MADQPTWTTATLAEHLSASLIGPGDLSICSVKPINQADPNSITFIRSNTYAQAWKGSLASAVIIPPDVTLEEDPSRALLVVPDADIALIKAISILHPPPPPPEPGIHPSAVIDPASAIDPTAHIGPGCIVAAGASIGPKTVLLAQVCIMDNASVGTRCTIHPRVTISRECSIADDCIVHSGSSIGSDGFGYRPDPSGRGLIKVPQVGNVVIESHVEIGANSCIDRATLGSTTISTGTKIDNFVQIAHNCTIGRSCIICGHAGLSGSVTVGDGVVIGARVGVTDNVTIGDGAIIAAGTGIMNNVPAGQTWLGYFGGPARQEAANYAALRKLATKLRSINKAIKQLQQPTSTSPKP